MRTSLTAMLNITHPIILAPLAGGPCTPELVAAVSNAGGLGILGGAYLAPEALRAQIAQVRELTERPFGVNLFLPTPYTVEPDVIAAAQTILDRYRGELGIPLAPPVPQVAEEYAAQFAVVCAARVPFFSWTFGVPSATDIAALRAVGTVAFGTATTVAEGLALSEAGVDGIIAQGAEAGGHRGTFDPSAEAAARSLIGTLALVPALSDATQLPVIAAGGIMDGRGLVAALALGAVAAQFGTAFLTCPESGASAAYKEALRTATPESTVLTRAFSGRTARGLTNRMATDLAPLADQLPPFPILNALTRDIRQAANAQGRAEFLSLWVGQGVARITDRPAAQIVADIVVEAEQVWRRIGEA